MQFLIKYRHLVSSVSILSYRRMFYHIDSLSQYYYLMILGRRMIYSRPTRVWVVALGSEYILYQLFLLNVLCQQN